MITTVLAAGGTALGLYTVGRYRQRRRQLAFIEGYNFHPVLGRKLRERYPQLSEDDAELVPLQ